MEHIISKKFGSAIGYVVESVQFSQEIRRAVVHTAKNLLGELSHNTPNCNTKESLGEMYIHIKRVVDCWNDKSVVSAHMVRNAIRVLDMRIAHCENSMKQGEWEELSERYFPFVIGIVEDKPYKNYRKKGNHNKIILQQYIGTTMEIMVATRKILLDSLMTISPEFE